MRKTFHIALREFLTTVGTKGFILGVLMTPLLLAIVVIAFPLLINQKPPKIDGEVAILDPTLQVVQGLRDYLAPEAIAVSALSHRQKGTSTFLQKFGCPLFLHIALGGVLQVLWTAQSLNSAWRVGFQILLG